MHHTARPALDHHGAEVFQRAQVCRSGDRYQNAFAAQGAGGGLYVVAAQGIDQVAGGQVARG